MMPRETLLVTGGAGYIGSHTVVELLRDYDVIVVDSLVNAVEGPDGRPVSLTRVEQITGKPVKFFKFDIRNRIALRQVQSHLISVLQDFLLRLIYELTATCAEMSSRRYIL